MFCSRGQAQHHLPESCQLLKMHQTGTLLVPPFPICRPSPYPSPLLDAGGAQAWVTEPSSMSRPEAAGRKFLVKHGLTEQAICFIYLYNYIHIPYICVYICIYECVFVQVTAQSTVVQLLLPFCPTLFSSEKICSDFKSSKRKLPTQKTTQKPKYTGLYSSLCSTGSGGQVQQTPPQGTILPWYWRGPAHLLGHVDHSQYCPRLEESCCWTGWSVTLQGEVISRDSTASAWL